MLLLVGVDTSLFMLDIDDKPMEEASFYVIILMLSPYSEAYSLVQ